MSIRPVFSNQFLVIPDAPVFCEVDLAESEGSNFQEDRRRWVGLVQGVQPGPLVLFRVQTVSIACYQLVVCSQDGLS